MADITTQETTEEVKTSDFVHLHVHSDYSLLDGASKITKLVKRAKELGMSLSEFRKGTSSMAEFDKRMKDYQRYLDYENEHSTLIRTSYGTRTVRDNTANPYEGAQKWATFRVDGYRYNELVQLILQRDQQAAQAYGQSRSGTLLCLERPDRLCPFHCPGSRDVQPGIKK